MLTDIAALVVTFLALAGCAVSTVMLRRKIDLSRASANHYQLLFDQNPQPMWVYDRATLRILDVNDAAVRQYGYPRETLLRMSLKDLQLRGPDGGQPDFTMLAAGDTRLVTHQARDGRTLYVEIRADDIVFHGTPARMVLATDVTDSVRTSSELARSASLRLATLQATADGIVVFDGNSQVTEWNSKVIDIIGVSAEDANDKVVHEALMTTLHAAARMTPTTKQHHGSFDVMKLADGRIMERYSQSQELGGKIVGYVWSLRDVTEKHRHDDDLRRQALVFGAISDAVILCDANGRIIDANPVVTAIFGYERHELIGQTASLWQNDDERTFASITKALATEGIWTGEYGYIRADGQTGLVESTVKVRRDDTGAVVNIVGVMRDVTTRREMERHRLQAQKLESIGSLAAGIAHEINTPTQYVGDNLQFLSGGIASLTDYAKAAGMLADRARTNAELELALQAYDQAVADADLDYLLTELPVAAEQSIHGCRRISEIVQAMKRFSHPDSSKRTLVDLNEIVSNTITVSRNEWKYVAELDTDLDGTLPMVPCYPGELQQVVLNLMVNAAQAIAEARAGTRELGHIAVRTTRRENYVEVHIGDDGCGIPEQNRTRVFDPFFTTKKVGVGTGQGLSISHDTIVRKHLGTLTFTSEVGQGTTFVIRLPLSTATEIAA